MLQEKTCIRGSNKPFVTKMFSKPIMERKRFRDRFLKNPTDEKRLVFYETKKLLRISSQNRKKATFCKVKIKGISLITGSSGRL